MTVGRARPALDAVQADPGRAFDEASTLLEVADLRPGERAGALWALGRAASELDRVDEACSHLLAAVEAATDAGLDALASEIHVSRSVCLLTRGDHDAAWAELEAAERHLPDGAPRGRWGMQRGLLETYGGRLEPALAAFDAALPDLLSAGDDLGRCRLLANRGVVHTMLGHLERAEADLVECRRLAIAHGQEMAAAAATQNLGFVRSRAGDIPSALQWYEQARAAFEAVGRPARAVANLEIDLCRALLAGALDAEAAEAADRAARAAAEAGNRLTEAEALLLRAQALLALGDADDAEAAALTARDSFRASGRAPWAAHADHVALQAAARSRRSPGIDVVERAVGVLEELRRHGWTAEADEVAIDAGQLALDLGRLDLAEPLLERPAAGRRRAMTWSARASAWLATATLRLAHGRRAAAKRALTAGMRVVESHRATLGATELRAHASSHASEIAEMGLRLAVEDRRPADILVWAERWHAGALALPPVRPPRDGRLAGLLNDLRAAHAAQREASLGGSGPAAGSEVADLERRIRDVSRTTAGSDDLTAGFDPAVLREQLAAVGADSAPAALIEYVVVEDHLWGIVATARRTTARQLAPVAEVDPLVERLRQGIRRLALGRSGARALDAAVQTVAALGADLGERLVDPLGVGGAGRIVVVPTGHLQALPWAALPQLATRPVTVAPSATVWCREPGSSDDAAHRTDHDLLAVAGPGLPHAEREASAVAALHRCPIVLRDPDATVGGVLEALSDVQVAHLAAHGTFRRDSPLFSSLRMSDGPLTIYDLEHVPRTPTTVVLPACDAAAASVERGDELIGTSAALLSIGVGSVVAPLTVVPDEQVVDLVVDLHTALRKGVPVDAALLEARTAALGRGEPGDIAVAHAFVAVGTWATAVPTHRSSSGRDVSPEGVLAREGHASRIDPAAR